MQFHVVTIFPELIDAYMNASIMKRAQEQGSVSVHTHNPRDFTADKHKSVDDKAYGGGPGMVMKAEPVLKAVEAALSDESTEKKLTTHDSRLKTKIIMLSPHGMQFTNMYADELVVGGEDIVLISGRYEGIDARVHKALGATLLSVGPYTLTGGELPALVVMDAVTRRLPGVLGADESVEERRMASKEVYTRPECFTYAGNDFCVPEVLISGDHQKIEDFRAKRGENLDTK